MKNLTICIVFLIALVLGLFAVNGQGQKSNPRECCCPIGLYTATVKGKISGGSYKAQAIVSMRQTYVMVYETIQGTQKFVRTNSFGNYFTTVDGCEIIIIHPVATGKGIATNEVAIFTPTNIFRDLFFEPAPEGILVQNFEMNVITLGQ